MAKDFNLNSLKALLTGSEDLILTLEMRGEEIRSALVKTGKNSKLLACASSPVDSDFAEASQMLTSLKKQAGPRLAKTVLLLRREEVLLKHLLIPQTSAEGIERELESEMGQQIPYDVSEVVSDYVVTERKEHETKVTLIVGHRRIVDEKLGRLGQVPLAPDQVVYTSEAILAALRVKGRVSQEGGRTLILDVDSVTTEMLLVFAGQLIFSKKVDISHEAFEKNDPVAYSRLFQEIDTLLHGKGGRERQPLDQLILSGLAPLEVLKQKLTEAFGLNPDLGFIDGQESLPFSVTSLFGAACPPNTRWINLLPEEIKKEKRREETVKGTNQILNAFSLLFFAILAFLIFHWAGSQALLASLESRLHDLRPRVAGLEQTARGLQLKETYQKDKWVPLQILAKLHTLAPSGIAVKKLEYERGKGVTLRGEAKSNQQVTDFLKSLSQLPETETWVLDYARQRRSQDEAFFDFQIRFNVKERE